MIKETARIIDQTSPHQLAVGMFLGAINCHDTLRVIKTEAHPFASPTDGMADMRGAADIVVSFDGSFNYGLAVEIKTTTQTVEGAGPFRLLKSVKGIERNTRQFERLINSAPSWWYLVIHIGKLTAKTRSEMMRALLDCPAALFEGSRADQTPDEVWGVKPFGELIDMVDGRLGSLLKLAPAVSPLRQLDLLPGDDVPSVTMDTPLDVPVWTAPLSAVKHERVLDDLSMRNMVEALTREWDAIGTEQMRQRISSIPTLDAAYRRLISERDKSRVQFTDNHVRGREYRSLIERTGVHDAVVLAIAADHSYLDGTLGRNRNKAVAIMPEARYRSPKKRRDVMVLEGVDILARVGSLLCRSE
jgi:hypothetical protein